jgi:hypothetical protein
MTTPSTPRKAGPLLGTGAQTSWPFTFKVFAASDIAVTIANNLGVETALVLGTDYSVSVNANQDTSPGGTVTYPLSGSPLPVGSKLTIIGNLPYDQPLDLPSGGNFSPLALENELDRLTMQIQQLREQVGRSLTVPVTSGVSPSLPAPIASNIIGWNESGSNLENYPLAELATSLAFATYRYDTFNGNGSTTQFTLSADPVTLGNLDVAISGVTQVPGTDYTLANGVLQFTSAPANGTVILARFGEGVASGPSMDSYDVRFKQAGTGAVDRTVESRLRESVSVKDFGAVGDGVTDDTTAFLAAAATNKSVLIPYGDFVISQPVTFNGGLFGLGQYNNQSTITLTGTGQLRVGDWYAQWDGFQVRSAVNNKTFIKNSGVSYWSFTNFLVNKIGAATGQVGIEFDTSSASIYFNRIDDFAIRLDYPVKISGNSTQVFNANKLGMGVGGNKWYDFLSAITVDATVLACDANEFGGYFESGTNVLTFNGIALRQNRFRLIVDAVTRIWNSAVAVNDANIWEVLDGGFTYVGTYPQNQVFIGPASTNVRATDTSSSPVISNATATVMTFDSEAFDTLSEFSPGTGVFQPRNAGYYQVDAQAITQAYTWPSGSRFEVRIYKNGSLYAAGLYNASETSSAVSIQRSSSVTSIVYMNGTTDTVEIKLLHNQGGNVSLDSSPSQNFINITRV